MDNSPVNYTDIPLMLNKIQQRLTALENKVDILVSRVSPARMAESKPLPAPVQKPVQVDPGNAERRDNSHRSKNRVMYKIICADCKKECEVPFRPRGDRPVYCRECFARRKAGNSLKAGIDSKPEETSLAHINHIDEKQGSEEKKIVAKKEYAQKRKIVAKKKPAIGKKAVHKIKALKASQKKKAG
ncbi:MAG: CxxC-x17-CxxC domain-containing protein [Candidatus Omnitrophota bacterium]